MNILIVAATNLEIAPFTHWLQQQDGRIADHAVKVLITGVGKHSHGLALCRRRWPDNNYDYALQPALPAALMTLIHRVRWYW